MRANYIGGIEIERNQKILRVIIKTSRPGMLIGKAGDGVVKLREKILKLLRKNKAEVAGQELKIDIEEVRNPESNAVITGMMIAEVAREAPAFPARHEADDRESHGQ